jgi:glutamate/tyrosine decarboxylase-like PLP-dependent enzyme
MPHLSVPSMSTSASDALKDYLCEAVDALTAWMGEFGEQQPDPSLQVPAEGMSRAHAELLHRLRNNYPFFHGRYVGQMLKPPHPAAVIGYLSTMLINPNNHALDGGPATAQLEKEAVTTLATMFGFETHLGHLTSSGTIANLEALFVARELHPGKGIAYSTDAHYTHSRMSRLLGMPSFAVPTDAAGRMDLDALDELLTTGQVGTVVLTTGTTGLGAIDPVDQALPICRHHGVRAHIDAAYGGFFRIIADDSLDGVAAAPFRAIAECDSVVIDPHKHGLQPYGCGAVLFRDPSVQRHYLHDSPYTYFTSDELHLGEISIECSRSGAAAAALWTTLQVIPPADEGLGRALRGSRRAALNFAAAVDASSLFDLYQEPELDIVTYLPRAENLASIDWVSGHILDEGMKLTPAEAVFVATYTVSPEQLLARGHGLDTSGDAGAARILRSVFMKPESEQFVHEVVATIEKLVRAGTP